MNAKDFMPPNLLLSLQLKPRSGWAIRRVIGCLEIGKYLCQVGMDRTILSRNLDCTYYIYDGF